jgi:hypothetical protein
LVRRVFAILADSGKSQNALAEKPAANSHSPHFLFVLKDLA